MSLTRKEIEDQIRDRWRPHVPPTCPKCGYNLTGLPSDRCPECGSAFNWIEVERRAHRLQVTMYLLRDADQHARTGIIFAAAALLIIAMLYILGIRGLIGAAANLTGLFIALIAFVLGCQVFSVWRVPAQMRGQLPNKPDALLGLAAIVLSAALAAASAFLLIR